MKGKRDFYPRYVTVYDELLEAIQSGKYPAGEKLPGENELAKQFGVSRNTLRQAIMLLHEDGYVYMHQGKGNFVLDIRQQPENALGTLNNVLVTLAEQPVTGLETYLELRAISPKNQVLFELDASHLLALIETVCVSNDSRIGCALSFVPYDQLLAAHVPLDDMGRVAAFYEDLLARDGLTAESVLRIVNPREPVTRLMDVSPQERLMMLDDTVRDIDGRVVMTQKIFFRPKAYEFRLTRKSEPRRGEGAGGMR